MTVAAGYAGAPFVCRDFSVPDVAVDLGTATLRICSTASDVIQRSSEVALRGGVIVDRDAAAHLLRGAVHGLRSWYVRRPRVLATIPGDANDEEQQALMSVLYRAGARLVALVPEPIAAAVGAGLAGATSSMHMIVDVGEGVTEVAVLSRGALLHRASIRVACADIRECVSATDTIAAFIADVVRQLDKRERHLIARHGVCLTGGGALISGLRRAIVRELPLRVRVPADPLRAVISGARKLLHGEGAHVWAGFAGA